MVPLFILLLSAAATDACNVYGVANIVAGIWTFSFGQGDGSPTGNLCSNDLSGCDTVPGFKLIEETTLQPGYSNTPFADVVSNGHDVIGTACWDSTKRTQYTLRIEAAPCDGVTCAFKPGQTISSFQCLMFAQKDCGITTCPEGTYASAYLQRDNNSFVLNQVACDPCQPGTFNVCQMCDPHKDGCRCDWSIPGEWSDPFINRYIDIVGNHPCMSGCYACNLISLTTSSVFHSGGAGGAKTAITLDKSLDWYCPGNLNGLDGIPRNCPVGSVHSTDWSSCVCPDGSYPPNPSIPGACSPCPPGYFCLNGGITLCPDHSYSTATGSTSCQDCVTPRAAGAAGPSTLKCGGANLPRQCVGDSAWYHGAAVDSGGNQAFPICLSCNQCQRAHLSNPVGTSPCYVN